MPICNFGRNLEFSPRQALTPASEAEVLEILRRNRGQNIRAIGRLHSWSRAIVADDVLLDLRLLDQVRVERRNEEFWATIGAGCQIKRALAELDRQGLTLPALGLISEQTIAGAAATGTHGSGRHSLSHYLDEVRIAAYGPAGEPIIRTIREGDELWAARCSLGCLGIVLSVGLRCRPQYRIEEHFREYERLEDVLAAEAAYPLTQFYLLPWRWTWMAQHRRETAEPRSWLAPLYRWYWFLWIDMALHLVIVLLVRLLKIPQLVKLFYRWIVPLAIVRPWRIVDRSQDMLIMEHELFRHVELEVFVRRSQLVQATNHLRRVLEICGGDKTSPPAATAPDAPWAISVAGVYTHHYAICIRQVLPDDTLISMAGGGDEPSYALSLISYAPHDGFQTCAEWLAHDMAARFEARPHWGKLYPLDVTEVHRLYPQLPRFAEICRHQDPAGVFRNRWLEQVIFAGIQPPTREN